MQYYSTTEKEAYAIVYATRHFRVYLLGRQFKLVTDHKALTWLHSMEPKGRLARWIMDLQEFQFTTEHKPGRQHTNADALSRLMTQNVLEQETTQPKREQGSDHKIIGAVNSEPSVVNTNLSLYYATLEVIIFSVINIFKVGAAPHAHVKG